MHLRTAIRGSQVNMPAQVARPASAPPAGDTCCECAPVGNTADRLRGGAPSTESREPAGARQTSTESQRHRALRSEQGQGHGHVLERIIETINNELRSQALMRFRRWSTNSRSAVRRRAHCVVRPGGVHVFGRIEQARVTSCAGAVRRCRVEATEPEPHSAHANRDGKFFSRERSSPANKPLKPTSRRQVARS